MNLKLIEEYGIIVSLFGIFLMNFHWESERNFNLSIWPSDVTKSSLITTSEWESAVQGIRNSGLFILYWQIEDGLYLYRYIKILKSLDSA